MSKKDINRFQKKNIEKQLKEFRSGITVDEIQNNMLASVNLAGLNNSEIAAVLFTVMRNTLMNDNNTAALNNIGIDNKQLSITETLSLQEQLIREYLNKQQ